MLEGLHVLRCSLTCIHPSLVANTALTDELHVGVGLGYLSLDILQSRSCANQIIVHSGYLRVEDAQLGNLGQGRLAVRDLVQSRIQCLQIQ
jgi:L-amino acid N-acyltransferase YncA